MSVKNANEVKVEKMIRRPAREVFQALAEGRLFNNCGAAMADMKIDFRVGGGYELGFQNAEMKVCGKFKEIVQDRKICFTWGDEGSAEGFPMTDVKIELIADGDATRVLIHHTGFKTKQEADEHNFGWTAGLNDMEPELTAGRLRIVRTYPVSRDKLYSVCSDIGKVFMKATDISDSKIDFRVGGQYRIQTGQCEMLGQFEEIIPGKKIVFTWLAGGGQHFEKPTRVTFAFDDEEDGESSIEIIHELLPQTAVKPHRGGWECFTGAAYELLKASS